MGVLRILGGIASELAGVFGPEMDHGPELERGPVGLRTVPGRRTVHRGGIRQTQDGGADGGKDCTATGPCMLHSVRESDRRLRTRNSGSPGDMVQVQMISTILFKEFEI